MNKKVIIVTADYNDGDYDTRETDATPELIEIAKHVCSVIKQNTAWGKHDMKESYNDPKRWVKSGDLTDIEVETFDDMCPSGDQGMGVHTIESVKVVEILNELI